MIQIHPQNAFASRLFPYTNGWSPIDLAKEANEYFRAAQLGNKEVIVKVCIFNPLNDKGSYMLDGLGNKKELFSIEFRTSIHDKEILSKSTWDPYSGTVKLLWKEIPQNNGHHIISLDDRNTPPIQIYPVVLGAADYQADERFLQSCYELHSEVLAQVFPEVNVAHYEI